MPDLSTLTTVITADTSGFTAGVNKAVSDAEKFRSSINSTIGGGLSGVKAEIGSLSDRIFSFSGLLHVGFGAEVGRKLFHELHEGAIEFASGMFEGMKAGESFFTSIEDGGKKLLGLKTNLEEVREQAQKYAADMKAVADASGAIREKLEGAAPKQFPFIKGGDEEFAKLQDAAARASQDAVEAHRVLNDIARRREHPRIGFLQGEYTTTEYQIDTKATLDAEEAAARSKYADALAAEKTGSERLAARRSELENANRWAKYPNIAEAVNDFAGAPNFVQDTARESLAWAKNNLMRPVQDLGATIMSPFADVIHGFVENSKKLRDDAKLASRVNEIVQTPQEKHDLAMAELDRLHKEKLVTDDVYNRRKQQIDSELDKSEPRPRTESLQAFADELQKAAIDRNQNAATAKNQTDGNTLLAQIGTGLANMLGFQFQP